MANYRETIIKDQYAFDDETNPSTSYYDIIRPRTTLDAVFDDLDANEKTLRAILDEMKFNIANGTGVIFPVTSVNGQSLQSTGSSDIVITAEVIPGLSEMINNYIEDADFSENQVQEINNIVNNIISGTIPKVGVLSVNHLLPDEFGNVQITMESLDTDNELTDTIESITNKFITNHNTNINAHENLFNSINTRLDNITDELANIGSSGSVSEKITEHNENTNAHSNIMRLKEDISNKILSKINGGTGIIDSGSRDTQYPSVGSVIDYVSTEIAKAIHGGTGEDVDYRLSFELVNKESEIPETFPTGQDVGYIFFVNNMDKSKPNEGYNGIVTVVPNGISMTIIKFPISRTRLGNGLTTDPSDGSIIIDKNAPIWSDISTGGSGGGNVNFDNINLVDGIENGTIRLEKSTSSGQIYDVAKVKGIGNLAYKDLVETDVIKNNAVTSEKIGTKAVTSTNIADYAITADKINTNAVNNTKLAMMSGNTVKANIEKKNGPVVDTVIYELVNPMFEYIENSPAGLGGRPDPGYFRSYIRYIADGTSIGLTNDPYLLVYLKDPQGNPGAVQIAFNLNKGGNPSIRVSDNDDENGFGNWGEGTGGSGGSGETDPDIDLPAMSSDTLMRVVMIGNDYADIKNDTDYNKMYTTGDENSTIALSSKSIIKNTIKRIEFGPGFNKTTIPNNFCYKFTNLFTIVNLPSTITSLGTNFMYGCIIFKKPLTIPKAVTSVGTGFMHNCDAFTGPLNLEDSFADAVSADTNALSTENVNAPMYIEGVKISIWS